MCVCVCVEGVWGAGVTVKTRRYGVCVGVCAGVTVRTRRYGVCVCVVCVVCVGVGGDVCKHF